MIRPLDFWITILCSLGQDHKFSFHKTLQLVIEKKLRVLQACLFTPGFNMSQRMPRWQCIDSIVQSSLVLVTKKDYHEYGSRKSTLKGTVGSQ